jgi:hypothetical protein
VESYDFLALNGSSSRQGRVAGGERSTFASETAEMDRWRTARAAGDGTHFRGYVDGTMVVHGHGDVASTGVAGLRLDGTGTVVLRRLSASILTDP